VVSTKVVAVEDRVLSKVTGTLRAAQSKAPIEALREALGSEAAAALGADAVLAATEALVGFVMGSGLRAGNRVGVAIGAGLSRGRGSVRVAELLGVVAAAVISGVADGPSSA
jgi:hypothetical protein